MPAFFSSTRSLLFTLLLLLSFAQVANGVVAANAISSIFGQLQKGATGGSDVITILLGAIVTAGVIEILRKRVTEALGLGFASQVRLLLFERLLQRPFSGGRERSQGGTLLPFVGDLTALRQWKADGVARGASSLLIGFCLCLYMGWLNPVLGAAQFALFASGFGLILLAACPYGKAAREQRRRRGSLTGFISDRIMGAHTVMAMGGLRRELAGARARTERMNRASLRRAFFSGVIRGISQAAHLAGSILLLLLASRLVGDGGLGTHQLVGLLTLSGLLSGCLADLGRAVELAVPGRISKERLMQRLAECEPPPRQDIKVRRPIGPLLQLEEVRLPGQANGFSSEARAGDVILLQGPSGSGKSLLIAMIAGLQPVQGQIFVAGRSIDAVSQKRKRASLGLAAPHAPLLLASVKKNLHYRARDATDEPIHLLKTFELIHLLDGSGGIADFTIVDGGKGLPSADVQALIITRAVVGQPSILLLDDVDDALSPAQSDRLAELVNDWKGVVVLSSQNERVAASANRVWTVDRNRIKEKAIEPGPLYRNVKKVFSISGESQ
jgi:ABC-type multidrug transport system fused ATPase/permease subunit